MGWMTEGVFNLFTKGTFSKPNFLRSPIKPMYGFAAILLIVAKERLPFGLFVLSAIIFPTLVEYLTAWLMVRYFNIKFWDYSEVAFNHHGYVCLTFSVYWVALSLFLVYGVHPLVDAFYNFLSPFMSFVLPIFIISLLWDFITTLAYTLKQST
jgi:uncharacterized membrane protein